MMAPGGSTPDMGSSDSLASLAHLYMRRVRRRPAMRNVRSVMCCGHRTMTLAGLSTLGPISHVRTFGSLV